MRPDLPDPLIKHVVVLMLENRGFDHIMGWLYPKTELGNPPCYRVVSRDDDPRPFIGLSTMTADELLALKNPPPGGGEGVLPRGGARSPKTPSYNTGESFEHIMNQMWGVAKPAKVWFDRADREALVRELSKNGQQAPPMNGYLLDYDMEVLHHTGRNLAPGELSEVLDTYLPQQMPVLSGLARSYAVSDEWFCSVPSQTNTNRAFAMAGTSRGMVNNSFYDPPSWALALVKAGSKLTTGEYKSHADALPVSTRSMFEVLQENRLSWKVYWQAEWPPKLFTMGVEWQYTRTMLPLLQDKQFDPNFVRFDANDLNNQFYQDARGGRLPAVSWIEPAWGGGADWNPPASALRAVGNDYHPVSDTTTGEDFVMNVYQALSFNKDAWDKTLLVITFDENGGTYDHVAPPGAIPPPAAPPLAVTPPYAPPPSYVPPPYAPWPEPSAPPLDVAVAPPSYAPLDPDPQCAPIYPPGNQTCPLPRPPVDREDIDADSRSQFGFQFDQLGVRVPTILVSPRIPKNLVFRSTQKGAVYDHTSIIATVLKLGGVPRDKWMLGDRVANAPTFDGLITPPLDKDGKATVLNYPSRPLSIEEERSNGTDVVFNKPYKLQYVGDNWQDRAGSIFMGRSSSGKIPSYYYPTLTNARGEAMTFSFQATGAGEQLAPIMNMSVLRIATTEHSYLGWTLMTVSKPKDWVFYSGDKGDGSAWQIRLLGSRERDDKIRENDLVYFVSQLPATTLLFDPFQRLMPPTKDSPYLTTKAGEWGLWKIVAA